MKKEVTIGTEEHQHKKIRLEVTICKMLVSETLFELW